LIGEVEEQKAVMHRHFKTTDVEDTGILSVKAVNGAIGTMQSSFVTGCGEAYIDIIGTKGRILYDYTEPEKLCWRLTEDKEWTERDIPSNSGYIGEVAHFLSAVKGEQPLLCTAEDGARVVEIITSAYEGVKQI